MDPSAKSFACAFLIVLAVAAAITAWGLWEVIGIEPRLMPRWLLRVGYLCIAPSLIVSLGLLGMTVLAGGTPYGADMRGHYLLIEKGVAHETPRWIYLTMERLGDAREMLWPWTLVGAALALAGVVMGNRFRAREREEGESSDRSSTA